MGLFVFPHHHGPGCTADAAIKEAMTPLITVPRTTAPNVNDETAANMINARLVVGLFISMCGRDGAKQLSI